MAFASKGDGGMTFRLQPTKPRPLETCGMNCDRDARWRWYPHAAGFPPSARPYDTGDYLPLWCRVDRLDAHVAERGRHGHLLARLAADADRFMAETGSYRQRSQLARRDAHTAEPEARQ